MPFTPFHFGLGAAVKAIVPRGFSFSVFCFAQVVADTEVLVHMARGDNRLHTFFHTIAGAVVVGLIALAAGKPLCQMILSWWAAQPDVPLKKYYNASPEIRPVPAITGAFLGSFTHVFLDGIMHIDVRPLWPFIDSNPFFALISPGALDLICLILAVLGAWICARIPNVKL
jgi:hypothetical protein